jgi:hypothetical protein
MKYKWQGAGRCEREWALNVGTKLFLFADRHPNHQLADEYGKRTFYKLISGLERVWRKTC